MADPKLEEFARAHDFKPSFLRNMQDYVRTVIQPQIDERDALIEENAALTEQVASLQRDLAAFTQTDTVAAPKRKRSTDQVSA